MIHLLRSFLRMTHYGIYPLQILSSQVSLSLIPLPLTDEIEDTPKGHPTTLPTLGLSPLSTCCDVYMLYGDLTREILLIRTLKVKIFYGFTLNLPFFVCLFLDW